MLNVLKLLKVSDHFLNCLYKQNLPYFTWKISSKLIIKTKIFYFWHCFFEKCVATTILLINAVRYFKHLDLSCFSYNFCLFFLLKFKLHTFNHIFFNLRYLNLTACHKKHFTNTQKLALQLYCVHLTTKEITCINMETDF